MGGRKRPVEWVIFWEARVPWRLSDGQALWHRTYVCEQDTADGVGGQF